MLLLLKVGPFGEDKSLVAWNGRVNLDDAPSTACSGETQCCTTFIYTFNHLFYFLCRQTLQHPFPCRCIPLLKPNTAVYL